MSILAPIVRPLALTPGWAKNELWRKARAVPSIDLRFADSKSLVDAYTGQNLVTHTRASSGTFVGSDGVLRTAVTNLKTFSDAILTANSYGANLSTLTTVTTATPTTSTTASLFTLNAGANTGNNTDGFSFGNGTLTNSTQHTQSLFVKPAGTTVLRLRSNVGGSLFDFTLTGSGTAPSISSDLQGASIVALANGWYRVSWTFTTTTSAPGNRGDYWTIKTNVADGTNGLYVVGAQLEQSATVGEYIPTTSTINSAPRFDHNPQTGESLGLLVEEARTNSIRNNTMVGAVAGTPGSTPTNWAASTTNAELTSQIIGVGSESGISYIDIKISGTVTASRSFDLNFEQVGSIAALSGQVWTQSVYLRQVGGSQSNIAAIYLQANTYTAAIAYLTTPWLTAVTVGSGSLITQRFTAGNALTGATTAYIAPFLKISTATTGAVDFTIRVGLPQLEQGAFATSPILTSTATVTRAADVASITGSNFGTTRTNLLVRSEEFQTTWSPLNVTVSTDTSISPTGSLTADTITPAASSAAHLISQTATVVASTPCTASVYIKNDGAPFVQVVYDNGSSVGAFINVNTSTGAITRGPELAGGATNATGSVVSVGNGWYRVNVGATHTGTIGRILISPLPAASSAASVNPSTTTAATDKVLLWGAQLEANSAVTPYIQSPSVFTSRASSGTYVGGDGVLRTAVTNLLLRSEAIATSPWFGGANTTLTNNTGEVLDPAGGSTATKVLVSGGTGAFGQGATLTAAVHSGSIWLRCATGTISASLIVYLGVSPFTNIGTTNVTITTTWQRFSVVTSTATAASYNLQLNNIGAGTVYAWGAQLEQSATVGEYIPTTSAINSAARYDHDPVSLISKGLLLEDQRTNSVTNNTMVGAVAGTPGTLPTGWGAFVSPTGLTRTIVGSGTVNGINYIDVRFNGTPSSTSEITLYLSPQTTATLAQAWTSTAWLSIAGGSTSNIAAILLRNFELNSGTYVREIATNYVSSISSDFVRRQNITTSFGASANQIQLALTFFATAAGTPIDITLRIGLPQLEQGAFATSVIPTTGSTVTRAADISTSVATSVLESSWYNQTEGTVFAEGNSYGFSAFNFPTFAGISNGTANNRLQYAYITSGLGGYLVASGGSTVVEIYPNIAINPRRAAFAAAANNYAVSFNGASPAVDTAGNMPIGVNQMQIGNLLGAGETNNFFGTIKRLTYWPTRLGNEVLQRISQ
jgi:hypothetical protein